MINYMIVSFYMLCQILLSIIVTTVNYEPPFFFLYSLFTGLFITAEKGLKTLPCKMFARQYTR